MTNSTTEDKRPPAEAARRLYAANESAAPTAKPMAAAGPLDAILADPKRLAEIDTDKLTALYDLQQRARADQARTAFAASFSAAQAELTRVPMRGRNDHTRSRYALLEDITKMLDPISTRHGFSQSFSTEPSKLNDHVCCVLTIRHELGHSEQHRFDLPIDDKGAGGKPSKTRLHGMGSTYRYARRYLTTHVWGVETGDADDDGNSGAGIGAPREPATLGAAEQAELTALMRRAGVEESAVLEQAGVESLAAIPKASFRLLAAMLRKRAELAEKRGEAAEGGG